MTDCVRDPRSSAPILGSIGRARLHHGHRESLLSLVACDSIAMARLVRYQMRISLSHSTRPEPDTMSSSDRFSRAPTESPNRLSQYRAMCVSPTDGLLFLVEHERNNVTACATSGAEMMGQGKAARRESKVPVVPRRCRSALKLVSSRHLSNPFVDLPDCQKAENDEFQKQHSGGTGQGRVDANGDTTSRRVVQPPPTNDPCWFLSRAFPPVVEAEVRVTEWLTSLAPITSAMTIRVGTSRRRDRESPLTSRKAKIGTSGGDRRARFVRLDADHKRRKARSLPRTR